jgi:hypothetical protein
MKIPGSSLIVAAMMTAGFGAPAFAEKPKKGGPDEVICERVEVLGTRLAVKRVCATRAEWAERRLQERMGIDKAQKTGMKGQ